MVGPEVCPSFLIAPRAASISPLLMSRLLEEAKKFASVEPDSKEFSRVSKVVSSRFFYLSVVGDAVVILVVSVLTFWMRFRTLLPGLGEPAVGITLRDYAGYIGGGGLTLMLVFAHYRIYDTSQVLRYRQVSFLIIKACSLWLIGVLCVTRLFDFDVTLSRLYAVANAIHLTIGLLLWRFFLYRIATMEQCSRYLRDRILFVGWNQSSERLNTYILSDPNHAYSLAGCIPSASGDYETEPPDEVPHLAAHGDLVTMVQKQRIDIVILADRTATMQEIDNMATVCEKEMVQFKVIPSYFQILVTGLSLQTISGIPILGISSLPLDRPVNRLLKRLTDIVGAIVGLILSAPLIAIFGTIVYVESPGAVFYRQRRLGRNGVIFDIIKIRSMRLDAEAPGSGPGWTTKNDPRRLKIGAFMRSWNIDELPQFWNVLKGEMSLVGPRPERPELIASFKEEITHYNARHSAKPGITGWAAVNGLRGDTDLVERIRCDLYYLENWSLWLDFHIMFLTFFRREGAA
ncbi:MAG: hypothetical protein QOE70_5095 [Chthoniobacter sp.]|jgi:exopolysaccharide biosynthesis polyprenyl glycosylphosphotransferase|nr:hypothetical protein [Chthoniobacter sp.]